ncbi:EamA family transporter RarD [Neobacillus vireti]|uniref:Transporter DMT superfamily protein n=1 Tax=Neobacillus vireti LMG 21834 TaxID=1131730 RepID=A0AB94ING6_9BACI|nr:EamA family transporter RarD [Neobacillus vireti]ETI68574.1 transporter DMT superfamily protein [Neobacillus vireti LMG 21834]KLT16218.1 transporter [Neobacillus vireti]
MKKNETQLGAIYAGFSYFLWGLLPIYWKLLNNVEAKEILANRIFWSFVFMVVVLILTKKGELCLRTIKGFAQNKKQLYALTLASLLITANWFTYIWAVNNGHMIEASLGYYMNPLVSIILGMIVLKEKSTFYQYLSFILAAVGVLIITFSHGEFPWIAIILALSFGLYGLAKKLINVDSSVGLTLETLVVTPFAAIYMLFLFLNGSSSFLTAGAGTDLLLIGAGAATAVPLLYFAKGAQKIPLSLLGFLQYIAPTLTLLLGIFVYHEHFSKVQLLSFLFIWMALAIYSLSKTKLLSRRELKWRKEKRASM